ncbi:ISNCY family transposase [Spirochaetota bacterium]
MIKKVVNNEITGIEAALMLGYTNVHVSRLKQKYIKGGGTNALLRPKKPGNRKTKNNIIEKVVSLYEKRYPTFNMLHFKEKLEEHHNINLCYESIRRILISSHNHKPKQHKKVFKKRKRMPKAGMLLQMDSSIHKWLDNVDQEWWLTAIIDDATNEVLYAYFYEIDGVFNNMDIIKNTIQKKGMFGALYVDKAAHFKTTRKYSEHFKQKEEYDYTHINRALDDIGIQLITANTPQAKGRIERLFGTFQDRLVNEMRLNKIKTYEQANEYLLNIFLDYYNKRFSHTAGIPSIYKKLRRKTGLDDVFCKRYVRKVNNDNTISYKGDLIQLFGTRKRKTFSKSKVDIHEYENGSIRIYYNSALVKSANITKNNIRTKKEKEHEIFLTRQYHEKVRLQSLTF